jgi:hypothetical protein
VFLEPQDVRVGHGATEETVGVSQAPNIKDEVRLVMDRMKA